MLSYIIGEVAEISADTVVVENNGIGFNIKTSAMTIDRSPTSGRYGQNIYISSRTRGCNADFWFSFKG